VRAFRRFLQSLLLVGAAFVWANPARAQSPYPTRPIQLVVTVPPGGAADFVARIVATKLADALGQSVIISNRGGAAGTTAAASVAKSEPDGYTLLLNTIATHGIGPHLYANLPYDPAKDFAPVILLARFPLIMTVTASLPARSVAELIALAKARPGEFAFASAGTGGAPHLAGELFKTVAGVDLLHVPYRGSGPAVVDLIAGRVAIMIDAAPPLQPFIVSGQLRPLAAASGCCRTSPRSPSLATTGWTSRCGTASWPQPPRRRPSCSGSMANSSRFWRCRTSERASSTKAPISKAVRRRLSTHSCARNRPVGALSSKRPA
jgi:tripartite-type tricarboxylate transporter receptor subunit TctC